MKLITFHKMNIEINRVKLENIENEIKELKMSVESLIKIIETLTNTCSRMDSHINFVEKTYDILKHPLNYITEKVSNITGKKQTNILL